MSEKLPPQQVLPVPLPVIVTGQPDTSRTFCEFQSGEIVVDANPVPAVGVINFAVARPLQARRVYAYIYTAGATNPALLEAEMVFWLDGSPVGKLPIEYALQPNAKQSRFAAVRSGGQSDDVLICWISGGLSGEYSVVGLNPSNWKGEIDRVTVNVKTATGITGYRIIVAVASQKD